MPSHDILERHARILHEACVHDRKRGKIEFGPRTGREPMHAVIGRVKIKPERADEALAMVGERRCDAPGYGGVDGGLLGSHPRG
jgi:hypothetical protein